jgi:hypothetical protein
LLASVFGGNDTSYDVGGHFSCTEADIIAEVLRLLGQPESADWWLYMHGQNDESPACACPEMGGCEQCADRGGWDWHGKLRSPNGVNPFTGESE